MLAPTNSAIWWMNAEFLDKENFIHKRFLLEQLFRLVIRYFNDAASIAYIMPIERRSHFPRPAE